MKTKFIMILRGNCFHLFPFAGQVVDRQSSTTTTTTCTMAAWRLMIDGFLETTGEVEMTMDTNGEFPIRKVSTQITSAGKFHQLGILGWAMVGPHL